MHDCRYRIYEFSSIFEDKIEAIWWSETYNCATVCDVQSPVTTTRTVATPGVRHVELVNGGYGVKHPLIRHSDVRTRNFFNAQQLGQADTITYNYRLYTYYRELWTLCRWKQLIWPQAEHVSGAERSGSGAERWQFPLTAHTSFSIMLSAHVEQK